MKTFSVKWYEPLSPGLKPETVLWGFRTFTLPEGRGWHEQTVTSQDQANLLVSALKSKGYKLVQIVSSTDCGIVHGILVDEWCNVHGAVHGYCR